MIRTAWRTPLSRLAAGLVGAAALVTVTPALASAADYTHVDAARDARTDRIESPAQSPGRVDRREASVDIRKVRIVHTADRVVVKIRTRAALPRQNFFVGAGLRVPGGATYDVGVFKMFGMVTDEVGLDGDTIDCAGYRTDIDRKRRLTTIVVPTTCLGSPAWVRAGAGTARFTQHRIWADDGLRDRRILDDLRFSPRIARG